MNKISVVGLGYVGLPLAVNFAERGTEVIGFDINEEKIQQYINGNDPTNEIGSERLIRVKNLTYTSDIMKLKESKFHIVAVPTPVGADKIPNLSPVESATRTLAQSLTKGSIVVFESTVYPGVTEDICVPILESISGLKCGEDFKVGYSPERINPGDKVHTVDKIIKVVAGMDKDSLDKIAKVYEKVIDAGVYRASSIKVAEAAKVIENSQRDVNIAFMNELALIFDRMGIDTNEVLEAAGTKWNFLKFTPGLVGGHCIGVDPYYLTYKAEQLGYRPEVILSGRRINDNMGKFIAEKTIKNMIQNDLSIKAAKVAVFGLTFKENVPDLRNSKVIDVINELKEYGVEVEVVDPVAEPYEAIQEYGITLTNLDQLEGVSAIVLCVAHESFKGLDQNILDQLYASSNGKVLMDVKGMLEPADFDQSYDIWRL